MSWLTDAVIESLLTVPNDLMTREAGQHVQAEGSWEAGWIRPSLLGDDCRLSRVKKYLGHLPQPGLEWSAVRQGVPNATTAMLFARGNLFEGFVVAALNHSPALKVLGVSPGLIFRHGSQWDDGLEAHPDVLIDHDGHLELIQIKNPSVFAFDRYEKNQSYMVERYANQMAAEMYIGRLMGFGVERNHLLVGTWEGWPPSQKKDGVRLLHMPIDWSDDLATLIENQRDELLADVQAARQGNWPAPFPEVEAGRFPCSYCNFSRLSLNGETACFEVEKWQSMPAPS